MSDEPEEKPRVIVLEMEYFFDTPFPENAPHVPIIRATKANIEKLRAQMKKDSLKKDGDAPSMAVENEPPTTEDPHSNR